MTCRASKGALLDVAACELAEERQKDLLRRLDESSTKAERYKGFEDCDPKRCGRPGDCKEACYFGAFRRNFQAMPNIIRLFANELDLFEVHVSRERWNKPQGVLSRRSIAAALQLNRRALDKLQELAVAVGGVKVYAAPALDSWCLEIHEIVAASSQSELERAFSAGRIYSGPGSYICIRQIEDAECAVKRVLTHDIVEWKHPRVLSDHERAGKRWRREYYRWTLKLDVNERLIRYGCDRYFNRLQKAARAGPGPKKKRPHPTHLEPYMFRRQDE